MSPAGHPRVRLPANGRVGLLALAVAATLTSPTHAQVPAAAEAIAPQGPVQVPTTKVLAIGSFAPGATPADWQRMLPDEVRATVLLYLGGKIDQWFVKQDQSGVVFIMNVTDMREAKDLLTQLPFGRKGIIGFQIIPLGPLSPLGVLVQHRPD